MALSIAAQADLPMAEMNTTPLIDVLLVLLIMFIMSVPVASHVIPLDLPQSDKPVEALPIRQENMLSLDTAGTYLWNGKPAGEAELARTLAAMQHITPEPLLKFQPQPLAPYGASARAINLVKNSGAHLFVLSGNEAYANFAKQAPAL